MLNLSAGGAAFLTPTDDSPPVGERVELIEMLTADRTVREGVDTLPRYARVLRHDDSEGITRRVAVQFEVDSSEPIGEPAWKKAAACRPRSHIAPPPPPSIDLLPNKRLPVTGDLPRI